ncbi:MAG: protein translocase subunit SecDF [Bacteroidia bacterium]
MQNKGAIRFFAILLAITCAYYLTFTYVTNKVEKAAKQYGQDYSQKPAVVKSAKDFAGNDAAKESFYLDSISLERQNFYLDSIKNQPVYDILINKFTYEDCKERAINLGLDLRGGMNITLEISEPDIIRSLSNNNTDIGFNKAIADAELQQKTSTKDFVTLFGEAFKQDNPNAHLSAYFQTIELKNKISYNTSDDDVIKFLRSSVNEAIATSKETLRARIDKFGVTQPNIQLLSGSGRILVELPGVSDKERVRKLLEGTANLEFWETYENTDVYPLLEKANNRLRDLLALKTDIDTTLSAKKDTSNSLSNPAQKLVVSDKEIKSAKNEKVASKEDSASLKKDSAKVASKSLMQQMSHDSGTQAAAKGSLNPKDTSMEKVKKENPLFMVLRPAVYQDKDGYKVAPGPVVGYARIIDTSVVNQYLSNPKIKAIFPPNIRFLWTFKPFNKEGTALQLVAIKITSRDGKAPLSGDIITDASKEFDQKGGGNPQISMTMTAEAAQTWRRLTKDNIGKSIAIVLDNSVYSFPTVQAEIAGGVSQITGNFTVREADDLVNILKAGKLPAPAHIVQEATVGPTLGKEAIHSGVLSFAVAMVIVLLFMGLYYNKAGWVADMAMLVNVFFVMGVLASLGAVLTLPGLAGIVLTIGMSVDANILVFERIREELDRGKGKALAIREGYKHALPSIVDSNITTLLLGIVLYVFGTGPIQGFATTLIIGILCSMFSAIFISRLIFERLLNKNREISFSNKFTEHAFKNIKIDFVGKRKYYYIFSGLVIFAGIISYTQRGFSLGVDFKGGRSYVVRFDQPVTTAQVGDDLTKTFGGVAPEVKTYGENTQLKITTSYLIDDNSNNAENKVETALKTGLAPLNNHFEIMSSEKVGETVSADIKSKALWSIFFACVIMFVYIFIRFKKWQYGLGGVVALLHDALFILSCFTLLHGYLNFSLEIDQAFIAAILTVMSYSINDTVVVFDRIREYLRETHKKDLEPAERNSIINYALNSTLSRTINTSLTIFFVLLAIFIFGGETIKGFSFALLIGIFIGTYSSICIATPIVVDFERKHVAETSTSKK